MAGYVLIDIEWTDDEGLARYAQDVVAKVNAYEGEFLARTTEVEVVEGDWPLKNRLVLAPLPDTRAGAAVVLLRGVRAAPSHP